MVEKYVGCLIEVYVVFFKFGFEYVCEIVVYLLIGLICQVKDYVYEIYVVFDGCCEKMDK